MKSNTKTRTTRHGTFGRPSIQDASSKTPNELVQCMTRGIVENCSSMDGHIIRNDVMETTNGLDKALPGRVIFSRGSFTETNIQLDTRRLVEKYSSPSGANVNNVLIALTEKRIEKQMSQAQLARLSGVAHTTIARIETRQISPSLDTLAQILAALNMKIVIQPMNEDEQISKTKDDRIQELIAEISELKNVLHKMG